MRVEDYFDEQSLENLSEENYDIMSMLLAAGADFQRTVSRAVLEDRGYGNGWDHAQIAGRNVAKLQEELAELTYHMTLPQELRDSIRHAGDIARRAFDDQSVLRWQATGPPGSHANGPRGTRIFKRSLAGAREELADVIVVALVLADMLDKLDGTPYVGLVDAFLKAARDVERGVRSERA